MTSGNRKDSTNRSGRQVVLVILTIACLAGVVWTLRKDLIRAFYPPPPLTLVNDSIPETIKVAAKDGWVPCTGNCLKLSMPGWHHQAVEGHPDSDIWMTYPFADSWIAYSQHHIGHMIRVYSDRPAQDVGICPTCDGTGWIRKDEANAKK